MNRPDWDCYFMSMVYLASARSIDESTHAGAVIVTPENSIVATGYNGAVRGFENPPQTRPEKYFYFEHAERNAIFNAAKRGIALDNCRLYVNFLPCCDCARAIVQSGIREVIIHKEGQEAFFQASLNNNHWDDSHTATHEIFNSNVQHFEFRWWSGTLWQPSGFFKGKEYKL